MSSTNNKFVKIGSGLVNYNYINAIQCDSKECTLFWNDSSHKNTETVKKEEAPKTYEDVKKIYDAEMKRFS